MNDAVTDYAIISHRWNGSEVSFQDLRDGNSLQLPGCLKIAKCSKAAEDGLEYVWIDSRCLDKASSAEPSEAINSIFR
jgi:hypothetical protein